MLSKFLGWAASIPLVLSWIPACNAIAGIHDRKAAQLGCTGCVEQTCAASVNACRQEAICKTRFDCDEACDVSDAACLSRCDNPLAFGDPLLPAAVTTCTAASCADACGATCGGITTPTPEASAAACAACAATNCCSEEQACADNADCVRIRECLRDHTDANATSSCTDVRYPVGTDAYHAYDACLASKCANDCAFGALWTCVGHLRTTSSTKSRVNAAYIFTDTQAQPHGLPGLHVRGCRASDVACTTPLTQVATTDANGAVTLVLPTASEDGLTFPGFDGYIEVVDPNGVFITSLAFTGVPVVEDTATRRLQLFKSGDLATLATLSGIDADPKHGFIGASVSDCAGRVAARMTVSTDAHDPLMTSFYERNGFLDRSGTETDATGIVAFLNAPAGPLTMKATSEDLGRVVSVIPIAVRPGALSIVQLPPTARQE